jgi:hypothetical protein
LSGCNSNPTSAIRSPSPAKTSRAWAKLAQRTTASSA